MPRPVPSIASAGCSGDIQLQQEFAYLAVILDAFSRRVIGG
jgi:hypothetical protein